VIVDLNGAFDRRVPWKGSEAGAKEISTFFGSFMRVTEPGKIVSARITRRISACFVVHNGY
jgi:hypothetical protein